MSSVGKLTVKTQGESLTVNVGGYTLYTDAGLTSAASFPTTISSDTTWYARVWNEVTVTASVKLGGVELNSSGATVISPWSPRVLDLVDPTLALDNGTYVPQSKTMTGAAAPNGFTYDPSAFNGVVDPIWKIGYNPDRSVTSEPQWYLGIEGDYKILAGAEGWDNTGPHHIHEFYIDYTSPDNSTVKDFRPIYVGVKRDDNNSHAAHVIFDIGTESWPNSQLLMKAGGSTVLNMTSGGVYVTGQLQVGNANVKTVPATLNPRYNPRGSLPSTTTRLANTIYYAAIQVIDSTPITGIAWVNGGTVAGNVLVALFDSTGTQVAVSNSVAQSGTFNGQSAAFTSQYTPAPGVYYVAIMPSSATATFACEQMLVGASSNTMGGFAMPASITPPSSNATQQTPAMSTY